MRIEGGCHCGFIKYEGDADPEKAAICHCTDCQTLSGSALRVSVSADQTAPADETQKHPRPAAARSA